MASRASAPFWKSASRYGKADRARDDERLKPASLVIRLHPSSMARCAMLFLASILDLPVQGKTGEAIGALEDLIVRIGDEPYPPIAGLVVRDGRRQFFVPGGHLQAIDGVA